MLYVLGKLGRPGRREHNESAVPLMAGYTAHYKETVNSFEMDFRLPPLVEILPQCAELGKTSVTHSRQSGNYYCEMIVCVNATSDQALLVSSNRESPGSSVMTRESSPGVWFDYRALCRIVSIPKFDQTLFQCWNSIRDAVPTLKQRWASIRVRLRDPGRCGPRLFPTWGRDT